MHKKLSYLVGGLILFLFVFSTGFSSPATGLFNENKDRIYQIQVVNRSSGNKSIIGSGFQISEKGIIATNYHVVSKFLDSREKYKLVCIDSEKKKHDLKLMDIDVLHDLALVSASDLEGDFISLKKSGDLEKGDRLYSIGNPYDLGMSIKEGKFNGLMKKSLYKKILFSGSLNPGMSGGPCLDKDGNVVGINVSTAGDEISFLVPVRFLRELFSDLKANNFESPEDFSKKVETQLFRNQKTFIERILKQDWEMKSFGDVRLPKELPELFKCWGNSNEDDEDRLYTHTYTKCSTSDSIVLKGMDTGYIEYRYDWYTTDDKLNPFRFYNLYEKKFNVLSGSYGSEEKLTEYNCNTDFVEFKGRVWKTVFCVRRYKDYPSLYDVNLVAALEEKNDRGLIINLGIQGVGKKQGLKLSKEFLERVEWKD